MMAEVSRRVASTAVAHRQQNSAWKQEVSIGLEEGYTGENMVEIRLAKRID